MSGISATQLDRMRAQAETLMPLTATIQGVTRTSDGAGGSSDSWATVTGGTVACRLDPVGKSVDLIGLIGEQESLTVHYQASFPHDAPIAQDRRVVVEGRTYEIVQLEIDQAWRVARRAILSEVR